MCTLSWWINDKERGVFFNRDESRSRSRSKPPQIIQAGDHKLLIPIDPDAGGTWIGINEYGLLVALLNNYTQAPDPQSGIISRGRLVLDLLQSHSKSSEVPKALAQLQLNRRRAFTLFSMDLQNPPTASSWDGNQLTGLQIPKHRYLTSSSFQPDQCQQYRDRLFRQAGNDPAQLKALHYYYDPASPAYSPLMQRPDSATESITEIVIFENKVSMNFQSVSGTPPTLQTPTHNEMPIIQSNING